MVLLVRNFSCATPSTYVRKQVRAREHYITVPLQTQDTTTGPNDAIMMRMWYVSVPFEVVCVTDQAEEDEDTHEAPSRQRPLLAVDFWPCGLVGAHAFDRRGGGR